MCVCVCVCACVFWGVDRFRVVGWVCECLGVVDFQALEKVGRTDGNVGVALFMKQSYGESEGRD